MMISVFSVFVFRFFLLWWYRLRGLAAIALLFARLIGVLFNHHLLR